MFPKQTVSVRSSNHQKHIFNPLQSVREIDFQSEWIWSLLFFPFQSVIPIRVNPNQDFIRKNVVIFLNPFQSVSIFKVQFEWIRLQSEWIRLHPTLIRTNFILSQSECIRDSFWTTFNPFQSVTNNLKTNQCKSNPKASFNMWPQSERFQSSTIHAPNLTCMKPKAIQIRLLIPLNPYTQSELIRNEFKLENYR